MYEFIIIVTLTLLTLTKGGDYSVIDLSDILNVDYMPGSLLVLENPEEIGPENATEIDLMEHHGTMRDALTTMNFHRKMMNEYLCRNYISEQIISEMRSSRIRRRLGNPMENHGRQAATFPTSNLSIKNNLIEDEGSAGYQDWLKKSATLEDIYRHYDSQNHDNQEVSRDDAEDNEEFDGHITGYAYQQPHNLGSPAKFGHSGTGVGYPSYHGGYGGGHTSGSGTGGGGLLGYNSGGHGGGGYGIGLGGHGGGDLGHGTNGHHGHGVTAIHEYHKHHGGNDKDKLADLFDVALTALAYLSFGMFIVQVIMCVSMGTTTTTTTTTMAPAVMNLAASFGGGMNRGELMGGGNQGNDGIGDDADMELEDADFDDAVEEDFGDGYVRIGKGAGSGSVSKVKIVWNGWGSGGTTGDDEEVEIDGFSGEDRSKAKIRGRREIPIITQGNNALLNELSRRVLMSIEAALIANQDDGNCLRRTLCENNLYSRNLEDNQKYWMPVWSLGMSWLSGRLIQGLPRTTSMLDSLKASILGLGKSDCEFIYNQCDLANERQKRRRRRKRNA
ncbi:hypothetical protein PPYR_05946 [Photinus pyralis]|uniref:Uncharacterized protein n=1 Tax=Photinus pyralis TaxID=7054 RepID=A0A5N4ASB5_PHOPY|nr:hypothetical protein PPYR_05946 [Photinus pyralis]